MHYGGGGSGFNGGTVANATTFTGLVTCNGGVLLPNNVPLQTKDSGGTTRQLLLWDNGNYIKVGGGGANQIIVQNQLNGGTAESIAGFFYLGLTGKSVTDLGVNIPAVTGNIAYVTDASAPVVGSTVVGGGAVPCLVWYDGAHWIVTAI